MTCTQQTEDTYTIMVASSTMLAVLLAVDVGWVLVVSCLME